MTVWIANPFDPLPWEGARAMRYELLAHALRDAGADATVWTSGFSHALKSTRVAPPEAERLPAPSAAPVSFACVRDGIRFVAVRSPSYSGNISLKRVLAHAVWSRNWRKAAESFTACGALCAPDAIVASSPPLSLPRQAREFASGCGARLVIDIQDAWPETFERIFPRPLLWPLRRLAKSNYRSADAISAVAGIYLDLARKSGFDGTAGLFRLGRELPPRSPVAKRDPSAPLRIVYAGNLGPTYDLETAVAAVAGLPSATLDIAGSGPSAGRVKALCEKTAPGRIRFHGRLDAHSLDALLASSDAGLVPMPPESFVGMPNKIADYSAHSLAILDSLGGDSQALLDRYGAGAGYVHGDAASLQNAIASVARNLVPARLASRRMAEEEFDASRIYPRFADFIRAIAPAPPRPPRPDPS